MARRWQQRIYQPMPLLTFPSPAGRTVYADIPFSMVQRDVRRRGWKAIASFPSGDVPL